MLFADVVHSMDIAAAVGAERLREIMTELADRCAAVVQRYSGTVDKFTGDGIMAVFGAPVAMEDHAVHACLAALGVQDEAKRLAVEVQDRDRVELRLRVGLNSGKVIAGEIGSGSFGYTAVGEQGGLAQRMERRGRGVVELAVRFLTKQPGRNGISPIEDLVADAQVRRPVGATLLALPALVAVRDPKLFEELSAAQQITGRVHQHPPWGLVGGPLPDGVDSSV